MQYSFFFFINIYYYIKDLQDITNQSSHLKMENKVKSLDNLLLPDDDTHKKSPFNPFSSSKES